MHPAIIIGTVRSLIVDVAMGQIPRSTERISSFSVILSPFLALLLRHRHTALEKKSTLDKTRNALQYSLSDDPHFVCLL